MKNTVYTFHAFQNVMLIWLHRVFLYYTLWIIRHYFPAKGTAGAAGAGAGVATGAEVGVAAGAGVVSRTFVSNPGVGTIFLGSRTSVFVSRIGGITGTAGAGIIGASTFGGTTASGTREGAIGSLATGIAGAAGVGAAGVGAGALAASSLLTKSSSQGATGWYFNGSFLSVGILFLLN
jgi:hypothetical protein